MGCVAGSQKIHAENSNVSIFNCAGIISETVLGALVRLDEEISRHEKSHPVERLTVITTEMESIKEEIKMLKETTNVNKMSPEAYGKTLHQLFVSLDLYTRPILAIENEDFVANVNRKEMMRIELNLLCNRYEDLQKEKKMLQAQIYHIRSLYGVLQELLDSIWNDNLKVVTSFEKSLKRSCALRDALANVCVRMRTAAEYAHTATSAVDDALLAWKLTSVGNCGFDRTTACADACQMLVQARCCERGARRVLAAHAAPRASRTLRLALDYAFTDALHDQKHQKTAEIFVQFKEALVQLVNSIHQVLLNTMDNLTVADMEVMKIRKELRTARVNDIVKRGLADITYDPKLLQQLNGQRT
ncbi:uncharacterized protein [Battus philenor]|uniref:uncharacterized protein n=1 Tax=Battus philenor TaxID=42288 RepID=UPI0035D036EE